MNITDPIADLLTRIRNAQKAKHDVVEVPASKIKISLVHIMREEGFVKAYKCVRDGKQGKIKIALKYQGQGNVKEPVIQGIERKSTSSRRLYVRADGIPYIKSGFGIGILSTSKGIMSCRQARSMNIGGELICSIY